MITNGEREMIEWIDSIFGYSGPRISEVLECNTTLTELDLSGDEMKGTKTKKNIKVIGWIGSIFSEITVFSEALGNNGTLTKLNLRGNERSEEKWKEYKTYWK